MSTTLYSYPFAQIMGQVANQVALALGVDAQMIRVTANDNYKVTETEDLFVYLRVFQPTPMKNEGAGRYGRLISRRVRAYIYTRSGQDVYGGDEFALMTSQPQNTVQTLLDTYGSQTPIVVGQLLAEELVFNALFNFMPRASDTQLQMAPQPLQLTTDEGPPVRKAENEEGLLRSHIDFEVAYVLSVVAREPAPVGTLQPTV